MGNRLYGDGHIMMSLGFVQQSVGFHHGFDGPSVDTGLQAGKAIR